MCSLLKGRLIISKKKNKLIRFKFVLIRKMLITRYGKKSDLLQSYENNIVNRLQLQGTKLYIGIVTLTITKFSETQFHWTINILVNSHLQITFFS